MSDNEYFAFQLTQQIETSKTVLLRYMVANKAGIIYYHNGTTNISQNSAGI
jgi:hypothetical protein